VTDARHAHFGIPHCCGIVAIHRAEIALPVDQHVTQGKILRHTHDRVIHCRIAMRMVLTDDIADDPRRLLVRPVPVVRQLMHRIQHPSMHRLQAIAHIRQRPSDDHAHRVIQVGVAHLLLKADRQGFFGKRIHGGMPGQCGRQDKLREQEAIEAFNFSMHLSRIRLSATAKSA
jgi:hypothetical protein